MAGLWSVELLFGGQTAGISTIEGSLELVLLVLVEVEENESRLLRASWGGDGASLGEL